jgi:hypothetical protein
LLRAYAVYNGLDCAVQQLNQQDQHERQHEQSSFDPGVAQPDAGRRQDEPGYKLLPERRVAGERVPEAARRVTRGSDYSHEVEESFSRLRHA